MGTTVKHTTSTIAYEPTGADAAEGAIAIDARRILMAIVAPERTLVNICCAVFPSVASRTSADILIWPVCTRATMLTGM